MRHTLTCHSTLAAPTTSIRPFHLVVETSTLPTLLTQYLTCSGHTTTIKAKASNYTFGDIAPFGKLYCLTPSILVPIGAPNGTLAASFKGYKAKDAINTAFSMNAKTQYLQWQNKAFEGGKASFALVMDGTQTVYAFFGGLHAEDFVDAKLKAVFA